MGPETCSCQPSEQKISQHIIIISSSNSSSRHFLLETHQITVHHLLAMQLSQTCVHSSTQINKHVALLPASPPGHSLLQGVPDQAVAPARSSTCYWRKQAAAMDHSKTPNLK
jgi:hypothetical protein